MRAAKGPGSQASVIIDRGASGSSGRWASGNGATCLGGPTFHARAASEARLCQPASAAATSLIARGAAAIQWVDAAHSIFRSPPFRTDRRARSPLAPVSDKSPCGGNSIDIWLAGRRRFCDRSGRPGGIAVVDQIVSGKSAAYREASEALHGAAPCWNRRATHYRVLWECGYGDLIRADFYGLFAFPAGGSGRLLDAGCGTGIEAVNLQRQAPGLRIQGVDVSSVALAGAGAKPEDGNAAVYQAALERFPFPDAVFDYIASHEVIEHVEDPAVVVRELGRVLKPGGVCVIATPNGASLWIDHLRQRGMRLFGRRGAPIGADHTRPPAFWRRQFGRAGFVVERRIFDGAALEFQLFVAPARWMPRLS